MRGYYLSHLQSQQSFYHVKSAVDFAVGEQNGELESSHYQRLTEAAAENRIHQIAKRCLLRPQIRFSLFITTRAGVSSRVLRLPPPWMEAAPILEP
jgi:hypothetical protein